MKKSTMIFLALLIYSFTYGDCGIFQSYIVLNIDGGTDLWRAGGRNADGATEFNGLTFSPSSSATIVGGENKTYKNGSSNVTGAKLYYHFYKTGQRTGVFTEINLPWNSDLGGGDQKWQSLSANINLVSLAISGGQGSGEYKLEVYWQMIYSGPLGMGPDYDSNNGSNFIATFNMSASLLPVQLDFFTVNHEESGKNHLHWSTATELNNSHFDIQRSADSKNWETIGTVQGNGTTLEPQEYRYTDRQPLPGINYYRLKQVDFDGQFEYSKVVSVDFDKGTRPGVLSPNPVGSELFLTLPEETDGAVSVAVFDLNGRIWQQKDNISNSLDVSGLPQGIYFVKLVAENGRVLLQERFVKE